VKPHELAQRGEDAAAAFLERREHTIVERNWKCAAGEVDVISLDGDAIVFTEVKTRSGEAHGLPEDAVDLTKQEHLCKLAELYLATAGIEDCAVRFDVVAIRHVGDDRALLRHHRNAFGEA
jgi:putative endonuclease